MIATCEEGGRTPPLRLCDSKDGFQGFGGMGIGTTVGVDAIFLEILGACFYAIAVLAVYAAEVALKLAAEQFEIVEQIIARLVVVVLLTTSGKPPFEPAGAVLRMVRHFEQLTALGVSDERCIATALDRKQALLYQIDGGVGRNFDHDARCAFEKHGVLHKIQQEFIEVVFATHKQFDGYAIFFERSLQVVASLQHIGLRGIEHAFDEVRRTVDFAVAGQCEETRHFERDVHFPRAVIEAREDVGVVVGVALGQGHGAGVPIGLLMMTREEGGRTTPLQLV